MQLQRRRCVIVAKLAALGAKAHASLGNQPAAQDALVQARRARETAIAEELRPTPDSWNKQIAAPRRLASS